MNQFHPPNAASETLADDLLHGADEIALFVFGDAKLRRRIYHLAETSRFPIFRFGAKICARKSVLKTWINDQKQRGLMPRK